MMRALRHALPPALLLLTAACGAPPAEPAPPAPGGFLLHNVRVIPMDREGVLPDHAVLVRDGVIRWVGPAADAPDAAGLRRIDGGNAFLVPGLVDMHVHLRHPDQLDLYLLNGVTSVANLSGNPGHLEQRRQVAAGEVRGPTIYTAGPTLDGAPPRNRRFVPLPDATTADAEVRAQHAAGYDFIKIYDLIQADAYEAAVAAAKELDMAVVGHIPKAMGLEGILGRHDMVAHGEEYFYTFFANRDDRSRLAEAVVLTAGAGLAVCPNTAFIRSIIEGLDDLDAVLARPEMGYLPPADAIAWLPQTNQYQGRGAAWEARNRRMYPFLVELTGALHQAGVLLVTGSDASVTGAVPGFSLHRELADLEAAGLGRFAALQAATANPGTWIAEHLHDAAPPGVIAPGRRADLLLVDRNPLADLSLLAEPRVIVAAGRWLERADILADVEARAAGYARGMDRFRRFEELVLAGDLDAAAPLVSGDADALIDEDLVNRLGYGYLQRSSDPAAAVAFFTLNTRVFPDSWNTFDSLGDGLAAAGRVEEAVASYARSLELNPENTHAAETIRELQAEAP